MFRSPATRTVCSALLVALLYGLGAAPCGCWEHSGWRAELALLTGDQPTPPTGGPIVEADDCSGQPSYATARETRQGSDSASLVADGELATWRLDVPDGAPRSRFGGDSPRGAALPVRADLQVFRL